MTEIIAEVGSVHDGSFGNAKNIIQLAKECGADTVKFQHHIPDHETLVSAPSPAYFKGENRYEYFQRTSFTIDQWVELIQFSREINIGFLISPFSIESVNILSEIGCNEFKVASGEVTNIPLLERISQVSHKVVLSSGMSNWEELDNAVSMLIDKCSITVMQCTSKYPCPLELAGLNIIQEISNRYGSKVNVGFSDHTESLCTGAAAKMMGANTIEKHLTFSKKMYGSDAPFAMEPEDLKLYISLIRDCELMLNSKVDKDDLKHFSDMKSVFQKSIVASEFISEGTRLSTRHLAYKKPGDGIPASAYQDLIGLRVTKNLLKDEKFEWSILK